MPFPEYGEGRGNGLCYLYADANNPTLRYFQDVVDEDGNPLECLGQGGRDPLSETMQKGINNRENYGSKSVEWAFWNDELQSLASSYYAEVCAYSVYSDEALPYTFCTSDDECGKRCSTSPYAACEADDECAASSSGNPGTCGLVTCKERDLPAYNAVCGAPYAHSKVRQTGIH